MKKYLLIFILLFPTSALAMNVYVDATGNNYGLYIGGNYVISEHIDFDNASLANIAVGGDHNIIRECSVTSGVVNNLIIASGADNNLVQSITSTSANGHGIALFSNATNNTDNNVICNSRIYENGVSPPDTGEGQGIMVYSYDATHRIRNLIVENNTIYSNGADNHDHGIYDEGYRSIVRNNIFRNHIGQGIKIENGRGGGYCQAYNNLIYTTSGNSAAGILLGDGVSGTPSVVGNKIYNNTIVNCGNASPYAGIWYYLYNATTDSPSDNEIKNNIIYAANATNGMLFTAGTGTNSAQGLTTDYNLIYLTNGGSSAAYYGGSSLTTLEDYQTASGQDAHSLAADPKFRRASDGNFRLRGDSPAIEVGTNSVVLDTEDIYGNNRIINKTVDMGAIENTITLIPVR